MKKFLSIALPVVVLGLAMYVGDELAYWRFHNGKTHWTILEENGSDSSPIIVGSGSVHYREVGANIHVLDKYHGYYDLANHAAVDIRMGWCPAKQVADDAHCKFDSVQPPNRTVKAPMAAPWTLQINDSGGATVGTMHVDEASLPGFMVLSSGDPSRVVGYDPDDGYNGDGLEILACTAGKCSSLSNPLGSAVLTSGGSPYELTCKGPAPADKPLCTVHIRYCDLSKVNDSQCK